MFFLSSETGWSFSHIGQMTEREIQFSVELACRKKGIVPEEKKKKEKPLELSKEDEEDLAAAYKEAQANKKREYGQA